MKIDSTRGVNAPSVRKTGKKGKVGASDFARMLDESSGTGETAAPSPVQSIDAVIAVQGLSQEDQKGNKDAHGQGERLLQHLEDIRTGLLLGGIPKEKLRELAVSVKQQREGFVDPRLAEILDDIELRARIELAKYDQSA